MIDRNNSYYDNLKLGLDLAIAMLAPHEPPDSRAVSDEFVALAALSTGDDCIAVMQIINDGIARGPR